MSMLSVLPLVKPTHVHVELAILETENIVTRVTLALSTTATDLQRANQVLQVIAVSV